MSILPVNLGTLDPWSLCLLPIRPQPPDLDFHLGEKVKNEHPLLCHFNPAATAPHFQHMQQMTGRKTIVSRNSSCPSHLSPAWPPPSYQQPQDKVAGSDCYFCFLHFLVKKFLLSKNHDKLTPSVLALALGTVSLAAYQFSLNMHFLPLWPPQVSVEKVRSSELTVWHQANAVLLLCNSKIKVIRESITPKFVSSIHILLSKPHYDAQCHFSLHLNRSS